MTNTTEAPRTIATATDVIDLLTERVSDLIQTVNDPATLTDQQFMAAFERTFPIALAEFLARMDKANPELAQRLRRQFLAEEEARMAGR